MQKAGQEMVCCKTSALVVVGASCALKRNKSPHQLSAQCTTAKTNHVFYYQCENSLADSRVTVCPQNNHGSETAPLLESILAIT